MKRHQMKTVALIAGLAACCGVAQAVTTPYTADFGLGAGQVDVTNAASGFVVSTPDSTTNDISLVTQTNSLQLAKLGDDSYASAYAAIETDLSAAAKVDFTMTTTVTMDVNGGINYTRFGFLFLGDIATETGLTALIYPNRGDFGEIRIRNYAFNNAGVDVVRRTSGAITDGSVYTFTLYGDFNEAGDLSLALSVVNADGGGSEDFVLGTILAADLPTGNEFGIAGRVRNGFTADYDSLTVIPSVALALAVDDEYILESQATSTNVAAPGVLANDFGYDSAVVTNISSGVLTLNPDGSFECSGLENGFNTFSYVVVNGSETSMPATVSLLVTITEDPPTVVDDIYQQDLGWGWTNIMGNVLNNDTNNSLVYELSVMEDDYTVANGTLNVSTNGDFVYTPDDGFTGTNSFTYRAYTPIATSDVATVTLIVENIGPSGGELIESFDTYDNSAATKVKEMPDALLNWYPGTTSFVTIRNGAGSDQYLELGWSGGYRGCYSLDALFSGIPAGSGEYWLYWEMYATGVNVDGSFGLSENATPNEKAITDFVAGVRMFNGGGTNLNAYAYTSEGTNDVLLSSVIAEDTWYGIWLNINTVQGTYDVYLGDAGDASTLGTQVGSDIPYGAVDLTTLFAMSQNSIRIDNIIHADPDSFFNNLPANLYGSSIASFDTMQLSIGLNDKARASDYWPISSAGLAFGDWMPVAHSDAPDGIFAVTNLNLAGGDATNKVIYVKTTDGAEFFQIENNE